MNIRLKQQEQIKIKNVEDLYSIMQRILLRETKIDRNREHFWTVSLNTGYKLLNIELISLGTMRATLVEPMEVFSVPLQKRAAGIILVHNHPSGELRPSTHDKDTTDRLIQCGIMLHVPVLDHLIISEEKYYSFFNSGLLDKLKQSKKYVPDFKLKEMMKQEVEQEVKEKLKEEITKEVKKEITKQVVEEVQQKHKIEERIAMAKTMKQKGYLIQEIIALTGLPKQVVQRIKV